jgi:hypothetical protein
MSSPTMHRPWMSPTLRHGRVARQPGIWVDVVNAAAAVLRPLVVMVCVITAAATWPIPAHADPPGQPVNNVVNNFGIGNNGPLSTTIAGIGTSICPMLVQPGATLASTASQMGGGGGLSPTIVGFVASMAIQNGCPGFMTSLANGNMPFPLQLPGANPGPPSPFGILGGNPAPPSPFGLLGGNPAPVMPFGLPGTNPPPVMPFGLPGASPAPPSPFQLPGL